MSSSSSNSSARRRRTAGAPVNPQSQYQASPLNPTSLLQQHNFRLAKLEKTLSQMIDNETESVDGDHEDSNSNAPIYNPNIQTSSRSQRSQNQVPEPISTRVSSVPPIPQTHNIQTPSITLIEVQDEIKKMIDESMTSFSNKHIGFEKNFEEKMTSFSDKHTDFEKNFEEKVSNYANKLETENKFQLLRNIIDKKMNEISWETFLPKIDEKIKGALSKFDGLDTLKTENNNLKTMISELKSSYELQQKTITSQQEVLNESQKMLIKYLDFKNNDEIAQSKEQQNNAAADARQAKMMEMIANMQNKKTSTGADDSN